MNSRHWAWWNSCSALTLLAFVYLWIWKYLHVKCFQCSTDFTPCITRCSQHDCSASLVPLMLSLPRTWHAMKFSEMHEMHTTNWRLVLIQQVDPKCRSSMVQWLPSLGSIAHPAQVTEAQRLLDVPRFKFIQEDPMNIPGSPNPVLHHSESLATLWGSWANPRRWRIQRFSRRSLASSSSYSFADEKV